MAQTLYDKLWDSHLVEQRSDGTALIYIDRQLLHEVTLLDVFRNMFFMRSRMRQSLLKSQSEYEGGTRFQAVDWPKRLRKPMFPG